MDGDCVGTSRYIYFVIYPDFLLKFGYLNVSCEYHRRDKASYIIVAILQTKIVPVQQCFSMKRIAEE